MEFAKSLRYEGGFVLLWRGLVHVAAPLGTLKLLTRCEMDLEQPLAETRAQVDTAISRASEADADAIISTAIAGQDGRAFPPERRRAMRDVLLGYFRRGDICFIATIDKEFVHSNWMHFPRGGPILVTRGRYLVLQEKEAYMTDGFTAAPWRGKGIHGAVNSHMLVYLQKAGYRRAYTFFLSDNVTFWRWLKRVGWDVRARVLSLERRDKDSLVWLLRGTPGNWLQRLPTKR